MTKTSDKQTYSVDEMMEKLRDGERAKHEEAEGELITRDDGTQVMRVRKRKRRTQQEKKKKDKRKQQIGLIKVLATITIPLSCGVGLLLLLAKYHSPSFLESVSATFWQKSGANLRVTGLSPIVNRVKAKSVHASWPDGVMQDQLRAYNLTGDLNLLSFLTGQLKGQNLTAEKGYLLSTRREGRKVSQPRGEAFQTPGFQRFTSDYFSFYFGKENSPFRLDGSKIRFAPSDYSQKLSLTGGKLMAGSWGALPLKRGTIEFIGDTIEIVSLRFEEEERHLILSGTLDIDEPSHSLSVEVADGELSNIGGKELSHFFNAEIDGSTGTLVFAPWEVPSQETTISCDADYLKIKRFAFLAVLEEIYGDARFREFEFEVERNFDLIRGSDWLEIKNLDLDEIGVLAIRGGMRIENQELSGTLKVGLPNHKKLMIRMAQRKTLFSNAQLEDGYFWFDVELSGHVESPSDNFLQFLGSGPKKNSQDLFEQLTQ